MQETIEGGEKAAARRGKYWPLSEDQCAICAEDASFSITDPHHDIYTTAAVSIPSSSAEPNNEPPRYPIQTPYISSCEHIYCYVCLSERMLRAADDGERGWECLRCENMVLSADRVEGGTSEEARSDDFELDGVSLESEEFLSIASE